MLEERSKKIENKLFQIVSGKKSYQNHPSIIIPEKLSVIDPEILLVNPAAYSVLELGAGSGEFAHSWMLLNPGHNYIAFEVKKERIQAILKGIDRSKLYSIKIIPVNFKWFLTEILPSNIFDMIIVNFPDPWPKKRHWKHRLVDTEFPIKTAGLLKAGGIIHLATDYGPYARKILSIFRKSNLFEQVFPHPDYTRQKPDEFPSTRFEKIHILDGKRSYYQQWRLIDGK